MRCYGEVRRVRDGVAELGARRISGWESNERRRVKVTGGGGKNRGERESGRLLGL
jgi:hypothetical protein